MSITLRQFKKDCKAELKGKKIILCEHLKNKSLDDVDINLWIGDSTRLLLCPICQKVHAQTVWEFMAKFVFAVIETTRKLEYEKWLEQAGKEK